MNPQQELPRTLTFSALSTTIPLLAASPAWPEVEAALARLRSGGRQPDDVAVVQDYADMLTEREPLLVAALAVGAGLGAYVELPDVGTRVIRGLDAAVKSGRLTGGRTDDMRQMLLSLHEELKLEDPWALNDPARGEMRLPEAVERMGELRSELPWGMDAEALSAFAWAGWLRRWESELQGSDSAVHAVEIASMAARKGPGAWLRFASRDMTIHELSRATLRALRVIPPIASRQDPPPELVPIGFALLGFSASVSEFVQRHSTGSSAQVAASVPSTLNLRLPPSPSFVVVREAKPLWRNARPIKELAILMMDGEEFEAVATGAPPFFHSLQEAVPGLQLVVTVDENGVEPPGVAKALQMPLIRSIPRIDIYPSDPRRKPPRPFVVAPRSPAELRRWAEQQPARKGAPELA